MYTRRQETIVLIAMLAFGSTSCDLTPVALETPTAAPVPAVASDLDPYPVFAVGSDSPHRFQFEIALLDQGAREMRPRILAQADRWARIVDGSDLEDIEREPGIVSCGRLRYDYQQDVLDDILVMVSVQDFRDGAGVRSVSCGHRESSGLPMFGTILLDVEGVSQGQVDDLILHAFGHMLGFGISWKRLDMLSNWSSTNPGADTHFTGDRAIAAFVAAGGAHYGGRKVPVENDPTYGSVDKHWRESVFGGELMTSGMREGIAHPLSAITIQSLADIGYTVDVEEADAYTLWGASAAANALATPPDIALTEEVVSSPAVFYDAQGRVVRVVRD